ncbi:hypothetical protein TNCV_487131 [Trichonephila clavipes]|nr:hypothetical protein TNCV_487131 [Trichonephila clavipes]
MHFAIERCFYEENRNSSLKMTRPEVGKNPVDTAYDVGSVNIFQLSPFPIPEWEPAAVTPFLFWHLNPRSHQFPKTLDLGEMCSEEINL